MILFTKQKQTHRLREGTYGYQGRKDGGKGAFGIDMYTLVYVKWITKKDLLYSTENSAQCYVAGWMGWEFWGRIDICIRRAESLCCAPETSTTLLISYTPT